MLVANFQDGLVNLNSKGRLSEKILGKIFTRDICLGGITSVPCKKIAASVGAGAKATILASKYLQKQLA